MKTQAFIISLFFVLISLSSIVFINSVNGLMYGDYLTGEDILNDSFIFSYEPDTTHDQFHAQTGRNSGYRKSLVEFNTTGITESSAYVYLKVYGQFHQTSGYQTYCDFYLYRIEESWDESTVTWNTQPSISGSVGWTNVTCWGDLTYDWVYLNITDDWNNLIGESFTDFYGYMVYFDAVATSYSYFDYHIREGSPSEAPIIYYSQWSLDSTGEPYTGEEEDEGGVIDGDFLANWFIYAVFLLVIPISITVYVGGNVNPNPMLMLITFLGAETLMSAISLSIGLVDLWFILVIIIVDVLVILGLMKSGSAN